MQSIQFSTFGTRLVRLNERGIQDDSMLLADAAVRRCFSKLVFLRISQCSMSLFNNTGVFLRNCEIVRASYFLIEHLRWLLLACTIAHDRVLDRCQFYRILAWRLNDLASLKASWAYIAKDLSQVILIFSDLKSWKTLFFIVPLICQSVPYREDVHYNTMSRCTFYPFLISDRKRILSKNWAAHPSLRT